MNEVRVKILRTTATAQHGTLADGTILRTSKEFAQHLVEDCGAAVYMDVQEPSVVAGAAPVDTDLPPVATKQKAVSRKAAASAPPVEVQPAAEPELADQQIDSTVVAVDAVETMAADAEGSAVEQ